MSDINGRLLFYTNGISVQNRKHELMLNGLGLRGELSSTNNTVIVPMPGNDSMYYLFTIGSAFQEEPVFSYNIIDMKGDGGFGTVVTKNVIVLDTVLEKIAAIRHCNNRDVWIVIQKWNSDKYYSYLLTAAGLNTAPVVSSTGLVITGQINNSIGTLKFTSKGNKLAACHAFGVEAKSVPELFPYGIYTIPEISTVGRNEEELTALGIPYEVGKAQYREIARGQIIGDSTGLLKLIFHMETHELLGVHIIGEGASELIHIGQAVMAFGGTVDYFVNTVFNYPTLAECYKTAAFDGINRLG